jgi:transcription-repair coupling factor (superfamily II helicase)
MLLPKDHLTSTGTAARKRLAAIRRCSSLGAGFQLELQDLELRGAGNLLGSEQSGHLCMIGFDLYCRLLRHEIARMQHLDCPQEELNDAVAETEVNIEFLQPALAAPPHILAGAIPPEYIENENLRLSAYRQLFSLTTETALENFREELRDRYGIMPDATTNLLELVRCRIMTATGKFRKLTVANNIISLHAPGGTIYRENGILPRLDYRDSLKLRLHHLLAVLRRAANSSSR